MLAEKVKTLKSEIQSIEQVCKAIDIAKPAKSAIDEATKELGTLLGSGSLVGADEELKTAVVSVCNILDTASKGLSDVSIAPLFAEN